MRERERERERKREREKERERERERENNSDNKSKKKILIKNFMTSQTQQPPNKEKPAFSLTRTKHNNAVITRLR